MLAGTDTCKLPGPYGYKWPRLNELYRVCFGTEPQNQHHAGGDVIATAECYYHMRSHYALFQSAADAAAG